MGFNEQLAEVIKQHDKEIRNKAIDEFVETLNNKIREFVLQYKDDLDFAGGIAVAWSIADEIAEKMKEMELKDE